MGIAVIERVVGSDYDKILTLTDGEIVRPLSMGSDWNYGVLLMRAAVNGATLGASALQMGWVNGTNNTLARYNNGDVASVNNLFGTYNQAAATYSASGYFHSGSNMWTRKLVNTTSTNITFSSLTSADQWMSALPATTRILFGVILDKSNPASLRSIPVFRTAGAQSDQGIEDIYAAAEGLFPANFTSSLGIAGTIDEATNGGLDTVFIYFNDASSSTLEISDVVFARIS